MTFEQFTIGAAFLLYLATGISFAIKQNYPYCLVWFAYAVANLGLIWAASKK